MCKHDDGCNAPEGECSGACLVSVDSLQSEVQQLRATNAAQAEQLAKNRGLAYELIGVIAEYDANEPFDAISRKTLGRIFDALLQSSTPTEPQAGVELTDGANGRHEYHSLGPVRRYMLDCHMDGMDHFAEFVLASDHDSRVHDLEALCDPAGITAENALLRDQTRMLDAMIGRLKGEIADHEKAYELLFRENALNQRQAVKAEPAIEALSMIGEVLGLDEDDAGPTPIIDKIVCLQEAFETVKRLHLIATNQVVDLRKAAKPEPLSAAQGVPEETYVLFGYATGKFLERIVPPAQGKLINDAVALYAKADFSQMNAAAPGQAESKEK